MLCKSSFCSMNRASSWGLKVISKTNKLENTVSTRAHMPLLWKHVLNNAAHIFPAVIRRDGIFILISKSLYVDGLMSIYSGDEKKK